MPDEGRVVMMFAHLYYTPCIYFSFEQTGIQSKLELRSVQVERHLRTEDDFFPWTTHHKWQELLLVRLKFDLQSLAGSEGLIFKLKIVKFKCDFLNVCIFVHFVLVEKNNTSRIVICFNTYVYFFTFYLSFFNFGRLFVCKLAEAFESVLLHNIELYFSREGIKAVALFLYLQSHNSFLPSVHFDSELIQLCLSKNIDVFAFLECDCLTQVVVVDWLIGVVVIDVSCNGASSALNFAIFGILINSFFLSM